MPNQQKTAVCTGCGKLKTIAVKSTGQCAACYKADRRAQGLDQETPKTPEQDRQAVATYRQRKLAAGYVRRTVNGKRKWVKE